MTNETEASTSQYKPATGDISKLRLFFFWCRSVSVVGSAENRQAVVQVAVLGVVSTVEDQVNHPGDEV